MKLRQSSAARILAVIAAFCIAFTAMPMAAGELESSALSKPACVRNCKAVPYWYGIVMKWTRPTKGQLRNMDGIAVWCNGRYVRSVGKKTTSCAIKGLTPGTRYNIVVRPYRSYRQRQWYNKKTKKWEAKKPAARWRGRSRTAWARLYSGVVRRYVWTKGTAPQPAPTPAPVHTAAVPSSNSNVSSNADAQFANSGLSNQTFNLASPPSSARGSNTFIFNVGTSNYVTWTSSNPSVASVVPYNNGKEGCVYINATGSTTITAKNWNGQTKTATITVVNTPTGGGSTTPSGKTFQETPNRYYEYNGVKVYLGQTWNNTLKSQLTAASDGGTWAGSRKSFIKYYANVSDTTPIATYNEDIYFFGTNTYAPFLAVYVVNGQIYQIADNAATLGKYDNATITRGQKSDTLPSGVSGTPTVTGSPNGIRVAWLYAATNGNTCITNTGKYDNWSLERTIAYHFHNAARVASGSCILKRSSYLEGVDLNTGQNMTWSGTVNGVGGWSLDEEGNVVAGGSMELTNARFGAQANAETMLASKNSGHTGYTAGPLAGIPDVTSEAYYDYCGQRTPGYTGENCGKGNGGEGALTGAGQSKTGHWADVVDPDARSIGCGYADGYVCIRFGRDLLD